MNQNAVLMAIERECGDEVCSDLEWDLAQHPDTMTARERLLAVKLNNIYKLAHGHNTDHTCHHVHADWRRAA